MGDIDKKLKVVGSMPDTMPAAANADAEASRVTTIDPLRPRDKQGHATGSMPDTPADATEAASPAASVDVIDPLRPRDKQGHATGSMPDTPADATEAASPAASVDVIDPLRPRDKQGHAKNGAADTMPSAATEDAEPGTTVRPIDSWQKKAVLGKPAEAVRLPADGGAPRGSVDGLSVGVEPGTAVPKGETDGGSAAGGTTRNVYDPDEQIRLLKEAQKRYESWNETDDDRKKREKRERAKRIVGAVGDGLRALSNLYFTTRGAPNMHNHEKESQLQQTDARQEKLNARQEKLNAQREADHDKWLHYALKIGSLEEGKAKTLRELEANAEKARLARAADERAEAENKRKQEAHDALMLLSPDKQREAAAKADKGEADAETAKTKSQYAAATSKANIGRLNRTGTGGGRGGGKVTDKTETTVTEKPELDVLGRPTGRTTTTTKTKVTRAGAPKQGGRQSPTGGKGGGKKSPTA